MIDACIKGLATIKAAVELSDAIPRLLQRSNLDVGEILQRVIELKAYTIEAQTALHDAQAENARLRAEVSRMSAAGRLCDDMEFEADGKFYVRKSDRAKGSVIPYCPFCWAEKEKAVPLTPVTDGQYRCSAHKGDYYTSSWVPPTAAYFA